MIIQDAIRNMKEKLGMDDFTVVLGYNHPTNDTIHVYWKDDKEYIPDSCIIHEWMGYKVLHKFNAGIQLC